jgi:hypothetical protein
MMPSVSGGPRPQRADGVAHDHLDAQDHSLGRDHKDGDDHENEDDHQRGLRRGFGYRVDAIDLNLDTLQLRGHRDNQGANISADIEHDRALPGVWILHGHLDNSIPSMPHGLRNVNCPEHQLGGSEQFARGIEPWESPGNVW